MAALAVFETPADRKLAMGLSLQWIGIVFLVPALSLAARQIRIQDARQGLLWTGCFVTAGWLLQQWEAGRWPYQTRILTLGETRIGNLALSLLLAGALTLLSLLAINATLWLTRLS